MRISDCSSDVCSSDLPQIREFCANALDPFVGSGELDFIEDLGKQMPMRVIGMLLGVPEADQAAVRDGIDAKLRTEAGKPLEVEEGFVTDRGQFDDYIDCRAEHPSDDIMTDPLTVEFEDGQGNVGRLAAGARPLHPTNQEGGGVRKR